MCVYVWLNMCVYIYACVRLYRYVCVRVCVCKGSCMRSCVCVFKEHFVVPPQHTFTKHLLCARMGLDGSGSAISAGKLLRQMGKQRASTEVALQCAAMRAVGQGTSDSAHAALPQ